MENFFTKVKNGFVRYFSLSGYLISQDEAEQTIRDGVSFRGTNIVILIIAIFIASLGLNTNSTAVIIGAMLISPLMGPIIGIGLGIGIEDFDLLKRSFRNLVMAAGFSVIASTIYFIISPVSEGHSELLARTSPTIYDVLIGFFGGAAGIIAIGSRSKGNVIPGVAIATALMPPLCTAGYGIATLQINYFLGAFYLFLINSVYIALSTFIGVKLMRYKKKEQSNEERARKVRRLVYTVAILALIPSVFLTYRMLSQMRFQMNVNRFITEQFRFPSTTVLSDNAVDIRGERTLSITLIGTPLDQDSLQAAMVKQLPAYGLQDVKLTIIQGNASTIAKNADFNSSSVRDIYQLAQTSIAERQATIDSLRTIINTININDSVAGQLIPELKVIFPLISDIAISRAVFGHVSTARLDTVNVALVKYSQTPTQAKRQELQRYLEARLSMKQISIVDVGSAISFTSKTAEKEK
ncbi:MAG: TIGR00341 family protein [Lachnoclostridium sp.]|nr:TIGR00341 family protein [Lachnoclostridium sp.]